MGHYGLLQVPDLLTSSFALRPDEVFIVANKLFIVANQFLVVAEPGFSTFLNASESLARKLFPLTYTLMYPLEFGVHLSGQSLRGFGKLADPVYSGGSKTYCGDYYGDETGSGSDCGGFHQWRYSLGRMIDAISTPRTTGLHQLQCEVSSVRTVQP